MWYGKYENYTDDDWGDNVPQKRCNCKLITEQLKQEELKIQLELHFNKVLDNE